MPFIFTLVFLLCLCVVMKDGEPAGVIQLDSLVVQRAKELDGKKKFCFTLTLDSSAVNVQGDAPPALKAHKVSGGSATQGNHDTFVFYSDNEADTNEWIEIISACLNRNSFYKRLKARCPDVLKMRYKQLTVSQLINSNH